MMKNRQTACISLFVLFSRTALFLSLFSFSGSMASTIENLHFRSELDTELYYKKLIKHYESKLSPQLHLSNFNRLFSLPREAPKLEEEFFQRCRFKYASGDCAEDTYYSWGPMDKVLNVKLATASPDSLWPQELNGRGKQEGIWISSFPIATYCYGKYPLRFKFKENSDGPPIDNNMFHGWWDGKSRGGYDNWPEWVIKFDTTAMLESVSFGRKEQFDEMVLEIQRRLEPNEPWKDTLLYQPSKSPDLVQRVVDGCLQESGVPATEDQIIENLINFLKIALSNNGWIHTQQCPTCSAADHFHSKWSSFFNP